MTTCKRGCCWTGLQVCGKARECDCHWGDWLAVPKKITGRTIVYRDPVGDQAAYNADRRKGKP